MNTKVFYALTLALVIVGGIYWWNSTAPQRAARQDPNYVAPEVQAPSEEEVMRAAASTGENSTSTSQTVASPEEIEAAAKPR